MKRVELEKHLESEVEITLFDKSIVKGYLQKSGSERFHNNPNLFLPNNYYFLTETRTSTDCISCLFRSSHVKRLEVLS